MYKLERLNVAKVVATEHERNKLLAKGFTEVKETKEKNRDDAKDTEEIKKKEKKAAK